MLVAKLRQKADRESQNYDRDHLKDSKLSNFTSKTDQEPPLVESTGGGYVGNPPNQQSSQLQESQNKSKQQRSALRPKRQPYPGDKCHHPAVIGDKCVANCRVCGIFIPKVSTFHEKSDHYLCHSHPQSKQFEMRTKASSVAFQ